MVPEHPISKSSLRRHYPYQVKGQENVYPNLSRLLRQHPCGVFVSYSIPLAKFCQEDYHILCIDRLQPRVSFLAQQRQGYPTDTPSFVGGAETNKSEKSSKSF